MSRYHEYRTPYGTVRIGWEHPLQVHGNKTQLYDWAHRSDASWPGSYLQNFRKVAAVFAENGDLVDLYGSFGTQWIPGDELNAWTTDVLNLALAQHVARRDCGNCGDMATLCHEAENMQAARR